MSTRAPIRSRSICMHRQRRPPQPRRRRLQQHRRAKRNRSALIVDPLDPAEVRVLGALLEKEITTPEYYPLSLNALVNACNQKSNREPVVHYDDDDVEGALERLRDKALLTTVTGAGSRVAKYGH